MTHETPKQIAQRIEIGRSAKGHIITEDAELVQRARRAIRMRRDQETIVRIAA